MRGLLWVIRKELAVFAADRTGAFLTIFMPVALAALVGMLFAPSKDKAISVLAVNLAGARTAALVERLQETPGLAVEISDLASARARVGRGKAALALIFPVGTDAVLTPAAAVAGRQVEVVLLRDAARELEAQFAQGLLYQVVMQQLAESFTDPVALRALVAQTRGRLKAENRPGWAPLLGAADLLLDSLARELAAEAERPAADAGGSALTLPITLAEELVGLGEKGARAYHSYAHTFAGMLCMFLLFMAQGQAKRLVEDRDAGTLVRLRMTPVPPWQLLAGVGGATTVIALIISVAIYAVGIPAFAIPLDGPLLGFVAVLLAQALFVGGFALLLAGVGRTARQIDSLGTFAVLVMSFTGGAWLPSFLMPDWLKSLSLAIPTRWATDGLAAMTWRGLGLAEGLWAAAALLGFAAVCVVVGARRFRWS